MRKAVPGFDEDMLVQPIVLKPELPDAQVKRDHGDRVVYDGFTYEKRRWLVNGSVLVLPDGTASAYMRSDAYHRLGPSQKMQPQATPLCFGDFMIYCQHLFRVVGTSAHIEVRG